MRTRTRGLAAALAGILIGCGWMQAGYAQPLGMGASQAGEPAQFGVLSAPNGRFVFGQISSSSKDQFMLDTATGRLWRIGESGKMGMFLKAVPYLDEKGEPMLLPNQAGPADPKGPQKKQ